jgi:hypothetical protein
MIRTLLSRFSANDPSIGIPNASDIVLETALISTRREKPLTLSSRFVIAVNAVVRHVMGITAVPRYVTVSYGIL